MDKVLGFLNNRWLVAAVVALFLLGILKSFRSR